jgi:hypothetical protein
MLAVCLLISLLAAEFKPRMEKLLADIVLMNEIAILSVQVEAADDEYDQSLFSVGSRDSGASSPHPAPTLQAHGTLISNENIAWTNIGGKPRDRYDLLRQPSTGDLAVKAQLDHWEDPIEARTDEVRLIVDTITYVTLIVILT